LSSPRDGAVYYRDTTSRVLFICCLALPVTGLLRHFQHSSRRAYHRLRVVPRWPATRVPLPPGYQHLQATSTSARTPATLFACCCLPHYTCYTCLPFIRRYCLRVISAHSPLPLPHFTTTARLYAPRYLPTPLPLRHLFLNHTLSLLRLPPTLPHYYLATPSIPARTSDAGIVKTWR